MHVKERFAYGFDPRGLLNDAAPTQSPAKGILNEVRGQAPMVPVRTGPGAGA